MKDKNLRITIGCLAVLTLALVVGVAFWWLPRRPRGPAPEPLGVHLPVPASLTVHS